MLSLFLFIDGYSNSFRLLGDLEEELMDELDAVCQENQLARYPVSRGRNSEHFVLEKYPELVTTIEVDKQRRVDSMRLSSRRDQDELYDEKMRIGGSDKATPSPSARKIKALQFSETKPSSTTPILKAKQSAGDLMFQMDDESAMSPTPVRKGKTPVLSSIPDDLGDMPQGTIPSLSLSHGHSLDDPTSLDDRIGSMDSSKASSLLGSPSPLASKLHAGSPSASRGAPWASPVVSGNKRDLKDIMTETTQSRVSNLTLGMSNRSDTGQPGNNFSQKMSQRERKKLQQIQAQEQLAAQQREADARKSPWQAVGKKPSRDIKEDLPSQSSRPSSQAKISHKPSMTLRQTVAGMSSSNPTSEPGPSNSKQNRSVSQPTNLAPPSPAGGKASSPGPNKQKPTATIPPSSSPSSNATPAQPVIQSIRHTPHPKRSVSGAAASSSADQASSSLASILLQQQAEKDEIREAATAKHNLQDIQAEQEFQEWWDKESKRVMEAEANAAAATSNNAREGKGRQRRKNRPQPQSQQSQQQQQKQGPGKQPQQPQAQPQTQSQQGAPSTNEKPSHHRRPRKSKAQPSTNPGGVSKT